MTSELVDCDQVDRYISILREIDTKIDKGSL